MGICLLTGKAGKIRKHIIVICLILGGLYSFCHLFSEENFRGQQASKLMADTKLSSYDDEGKIYVTDSRHVYYVIKTYCSDNDTVYLVRSGEKYESLTEVKNAQYAIILNDGPLKDEVDSSWEHLDDYHLEVYDVKAYENKRRP